MDHSGAITPIKTGDEIEVDRAKMTDTQVLVRRNGVWIELRPEADPDVVKNTETLKDLIRQFCDAKGVFQGDGPPMAYVRTPPDNNGAVRTFVYIAFGNDGIYPEGHYMRPRATFAEAIQHALPAFDAWLQRGRTLVWRTRPLVERHDGLWRVYWRCVQLDDGARSIAIDWHF